MQGQGQGQGLDVVHEEFKAHCTGFEQKHLWLRIKPDSFIRNTWLEVKELSCSVSHLVLIKLVCPQAHHWHNNMCGDKVLGTGDAKIDQDGRLLLIPCCNAPDPRIGKACNKCMNEPHDTTQHTSRSHACQFDGAGDATCRAWHGRRHHLQYTS